MRMHEEKVDVSDAGKPGENGEPSNQNAPGTSDLTISQKYRELRNRLKYLIYERRCFESELSKAQSKLIELSQDKTVLLDQLLQYEPVSGEEEEATDYSGSEDEVPGDARLHRPSVSVAKTEAPSSSLKVNSVRQRSRSPVGGSPLPPAAKPANLTKQGIAKATAIINSVSNNIASKVSKAGTKRQAKPVGKLGAAVKISKTISRVRQNNVPDTSSVLLGVGVAGSSAGKQKLVVSYPITSISATTTAEAAPALATAPAPSTLTTLTISTVSTSAAPPQTASKPLNRPLPPLTKAQPPPNASSSSSSSSTSTSSSSSLHISSVGSVRVTAVAAPGIPPLIPDTSKGRNSSSSASSSSSSSSSSGSGESGSDLSSGSEDEAMDTEDVGERVVGEGPVQIISSVKSSSDLPRPKAILSPVKMAPPMLLKGGMPTPPPAIPSPSQPAFSGWSQSPAGVSSTEGNSPLMMASEVVGGFAPIASPLTSPSSALPFSSLNNRGAGTSAFQVFSPKHATPASQTSLTRSSSTSSLHAVKTTPTSKVENTPNSANHSTKS